MSALVLRVKFPATYPLIYKTLRIDATMTVKEAIVYISQTLNIPEETGIGLYLPDERIWLEMEKKLNDYIEKLQDIEHIEYKYLNQKEDPKASGNPSCCIIV